MNLVWRTNALPLTRWNKCHPRLEMQRNRRTTGLLSDCGFCLSRAKNVPSCCRCRPCGKTSTKCCDLKRHILSKHAKPTNEICPTCHRTYKNKPSLQAHISSKKCTMLKPQKPHSRDDFWFIVGAAKNGQFWTPPIFSLVLWSCVWNQQQKLCFIISPPCFYFRWAVAWRNGFLGQEFWRPRSKSLYLQALWLHHRPFNNCSPTHDQKTCSA